MISGNMRPLARVSTGGVSSVNFNSSNMNGCTVFCIQYTYYAGGSITGDQNMQVTLNADGSNYKQGIQFFDYGDSTSTGGSSTNLWWNVDETAASYLFQGTGKPIAGDGASGELWVKSNMRDSSYAMMYNRNVCWTDLNDLAASSSTIAWSGSSGGNQITSILFTPSSGTIVMNAVLWGGAD